ncbi:hypothetical protein D3C86_2064430 [compost metagenome]
MLTPVDCACYGQCVGFCFGNVEALAIELHRRHGFFRVGNDGDVGTQTNFFAVLGNEEAGLAFDAHSHGGVLFSAGSKVLGRSRGSSFCATD